MIEDEDKMLTDKAHCRARAYDIVLNGTEELDELAERVEHTTREQVTAAAQKLTLDTVYFLKGKE